MFPMARVWLGALECPMQRQSTRLRCPLGATVCLSVLVCAVFLAVLSPTLATTPNDSENRYGHLIAEDVNPAVLPYPLGSFNGLVIEDEGHGAGEARGLDIIQRAPEGVPSLGNNQFQSRDILMGEIQYWYVPKDLIGTHITNNTSNKQSNNTSKRSTTTVYLSLTICSKPILNESISASAAQPLPQLAVYVSSSNSLQKPGPDKDSNDQTVYHSVEGYMSAEVSTEGEVYIGIAAPESGDYTGSYSYQMAASTDDFFHSVDDQTAMLSFVDSGSDAALLSTVRPADEILTSEQMKLWKNNTTVYTIFVNNANSTAIAGLQRSYCALERHSQAGKDDNVKTSMSKRKREDNGLQEQFYITGLNRSSTYVGVLAMTGNSTRSGNGMVGGGGKVWKPKNFTTKADGNCAVIYDLDFCSDVAYAVPSHPSMKFSELRAKYDDNAANLYKNFNYSLQQIQCNTSNETIFSMAVNCNDCTNAYKSWLCAVTIPRCDDFSSTSFSPSLVVRNAAQPFPNGTSITNKTLLENPATSHSRNPDSLIDKEIKPGPYKEMLPSIDVCYELVRTCPMTLGFQCPKGKWLAYSYSRSAASGLLLPSIAITSVIASLCVSGLFWLF